MIFDAEQVERSFETISPQLDRLTASFYDDLLSTHPQLQPIFANVDIVRLRRKLAGMLTLIVTNLRRPDVLSAVLRTLGSRHGRYGATLDAYDWTEVCLLRTIAKLAGPGWDQRTADAWTSAIALVIEEMKAGHEQDARPATPTDDIDVLLELAANPSLAFQRESLFTTYIDRKRADHEMSLARSVQQNLIRTDTPSTHTVSMTVRYEPAALVGGDYFDWTMTTDGQLVVVVGDVTGKGLPAALLMCNLSGAARVAFSHQQDIMGALSAVNSHMCGVAPDGRFVTLVCARIDLADGRVTLANAGHPTPVLWRAVGDARFLDAADGGIPIGIDPRYPYAAQQHTIDPGDTIILYTDGVTEARSPTGELFGTERLLARAMSCSNGSNIADCILDGVRDFCRGRPPADDLTIVTVSRLHTP